MPAAQTSSYLAAYRGQGGFRISIYQIGNPAAFMVTVPWDGPSEGALSALEGADNGQTSPDRGPEQLCPLSLDRNRVPHRRPAVRWIRRRADGPPVSRRRRAYPASLVHHGGADSTSSFDIGPAYRAIGSFATCVPVMPPTIRRSLRVRGIRSCADFNSASRSGFDAVLVSTYLMYFPHCVAIGKICRDRGVPMLLGGPYFADKDVARQWIDIPGLAALVGGEVEPHLCELVDGSLITKPTATSGRLVTRRRGYRALMLRH